MKRACVIGWPIAHSLSPIIHRHWLKVYGINGNYERKEVEPQHFVQFIHSLPTLGFAGCNVTLPHKIEAYALCDYRDEAAERVGAVNTIWFEGPAVHGSNTDGLGFLANLDEEAPNWSSQSGSAVLIGAGGAARAIAFALQARGFDSITIVNRSVGRAEELAQSLRGAKAFPLESLSAVLNGANFIVNTSTLGMKGADPLSIDLQDVSPTAVVCDIVYSPLETDLLRQARSHNLRAVDGLGMLLHQAVPGFEKWFGVKPKVTEALRGEVLAALEKRESQTP